jgi:YidC/Oxa1 family membrane protein insertase
MLEFFSNITGGSYALALLLYALVFKIVFLPFTIKQQKNQIAMAKLTPKIQLIKAKYKGRTDQVTMRKQQEEIMALQQQEGYSPLSGCLPLLLQMPLIIFLYNVIRNPLSYIAKASEEAIVAVYNAVNNLVGEAAFTIESFSKIDQITLAGQVKDFAGAADILGAETLARVPNFTLFGQNLAATPSLSNFSWLVIIPVLAAASQWFTMWITRKINGQPGQLQDSDAQSQVSMKMMDLMMPAMTLFLAFSFSGMLGIYWVYQSLLSILQTIIMSKVMPLPKYTEAEIKAMRKAEKEVEKAQRQAIKSQPKYKSLHYIDEDDYDELPTVKTNTNDKKTNLQDIPEIKD